MQQRIEALDGLRFLAAMGVLWIHCWTIHHNPRFFIGPVDIASFLAIGVNGVELFFVISGFCMYYFYASRTGFSYHDLYRFLLKRWLRLSPAFYVASLIYILVDKYIYHHNLNVVMNMVHSVFYLDHLLGNYFTASHFWTLTVEWQFYFVLPFILIWQNIAGFKKCFAAIFGIVFLAAVVSVLILKNESDYLTGTFLFRGVEFGFGVLAARLLIHTNNIFKNRTLWFLLFFIIVYSGRVLVSGPVLNLSAYYYNLFKLAGFTLMGAGFAGILYLSITSAHKLHSFLGNRLFKKMGRISYSFYLLHALIYPVIAGWVIVYLPALRGIAAPVATMLISAVILYPIALLSYNLLERPFLKMKLNPRKQATGAILPERQ